MNNSNNRNYYIDFLKLIFSVIIVCYHSWIFTGNFGSGIFNRGFYAVDFYFIVTGFLFIKSVEKIYNEKHNEPVGLLDIKFVFNKIKNILPSIILIFIIGYILVFRRDAIDYHIALSDSIVTEFFGLGFLGKGMLVNLGCWYVSIMILVLFILFPIAYKYKKNFNYLIAPLIIILTLGICNYNSINIMDPLSKKFIFINGFYKGLIFINLGVLSYELCSYLKKIELSRKIRSFMTIIETIIYLFLILNMHYAIAGSYICAILFTFNIALTFSNISFTANIFNSSIFQKLGKFGFCLYLSNIPVRYFVDLKFSYSYRNMFLIYWVLVIILSFFVYLISEFILKKVYKKV